MMQLRRAKIRLGHLAKLSSLFFTQNLAATIYSYCSNSKTFHLISSLIVLVSGDRQLWCPGMSLMSKLIVRKRKKSP